MPNLTKKKADRPDERMDGKTLIIEKLCFLKESFIAATLV